MTSLESYIRSLHNDFFYKEYTYSCTQFAPPGQTQIELADNVVWLDDILFIIQMKQREEKPTDTDLEAAKWFDNKVLKKAATQIKNTLIHLTSQEEIIISNDSTHTFDLTKAPLQSAKKIIIYNVPGSLLPEEKRKLKFQISSTAGFIHLFHVEDYSWVCKYLVTPCEIDEYLSFRERLYQKHPVLDQLPEQYVLGHYFAGDVNDPLTASYINSLTQLVDNTEEFDLTHFISIFSKRLTTVEGSLPEDYYHIQRELAKLARNELKEFKLRLQLSVEKVQTDEFTRPYRIYLPRTDCSFVLILLQKHNAGHWKTALHNFTMAHKYDSKARKGVGVVLFYGTTGDGMIEAYWQFVNSPWEYDEELETILKNDFPFRPVKSEEKFRYFLKK